MRGRLVTAKEDIESGEMVLVQVPGNLAQPARERTHRLLPGSSWIVAKAREPIRSGETGLVDDVDTARH
jgi:hypothetical protein